jgi:hypothetical protein
MSMYVILRREGWQSPAELEDAAGRSGHGDRQAGPGRRRWISDS